MIANLKLNAAIAAASILGLMALSPLATFAQQASSSPTSITGANQATRMATIKTKAKAEIDKRLVSLNTASTKINTATKLTASDKAAFTLQIQTNTANLIGFGPKLPPTQT